MRKFIVLIAALAVAAAVQTSPPRVRTNRGDIEGCQFEQSHRSAEASWCGAVGAGA